MHFYKRGREGSWIHGHRHVYENCAAKRGRSERREQTFQNKKGWGEGGGGSMTKPLMPKEPPDKKNRQQTTSPYDGSLELNFFLFLAPKNYHPEPPTTQSRGFYFRSCLEFHQGKRASKQ